MCPHLLRAHLSRVITYGLAVCCCAPASAAAQVVGVRDLGMLGKTYSFSMELDPADSPVGNAFTASNAVQYAKLNRTSGGFVVGVPGSAGGLVIGIDTSERGVGYAYMAHGAVEQATMFSTTGRVNTATGTLAGAYRYTRDTDNPLWWAVPHHHLADLAPAQASDGS